VHVDKLSSLYSLSQEVLVVPFLLFRRRYRSAYRRPAHLSAKFLDFFPICG